MTENCEQGVQVGLNDQIGRIVLDRPRALNALTLPMVQRIHQALSGWSSLPLRAVIISSSSERAFCAGGDIRQIRQNTLDGAYEASDEFFATEYEVNEMLGRSPAPVVSLIDGICMGGGLGLSVHGSFRVVTERASFSMPETAIGFFPDVGASYFLPRLPGAVGTYLGLTGTRIDAADALDAGLATHFVDRSVLLDLPALLSTDLREVETVLRSVGSRPLNGSALAEHRRAIDWCFGAPDVATIGARLFTEDTPWATKALEAMQRVSPQSLAETFDLLAKGSRLGLRECLEAEREVARRVVRTPDFIEGVRSVLVDKDHAPRWSASDLRGAAAGPESCGLQRDDDDGSR